VVNFLDSADCLFDDNIPNCFHFCENAVFTGSPRIPVIVEGVWVPMLIDTGAEVTVTRYFYSVCFPIENFLTRNGKSDPWVATTLPLRDPSH